MRFLKCLWKATGLVVVALAVSCVIITWVYIITKIPVIVGIIGTIMFAILMVALYMYSLE